MSGEHLTSSSGERMVVTSHPLAGQAVIAILDDAGSAADAAVAAAAVLNVFDPVPQNRRRRLLPLASSPAAHQLIVRSSDGFTAVSDPRKDGVASG